MRSLRYVPLSLASLTSLALLGFAACAPPVPEAAQPAAQSPDSGIVVTHSAPRRPHDDVTPQPPIDAGMSAYDPPPQCPADLALGAGVRLAASTNARDFGLSVTHDELSAAWMTEAGGEVTIHYVDRASATDAFGAARTVTGAFTPGRVALSSDGLDLAVVDADGLGFSVLRRAARTEALGEPEVGPFTNITAEGHEVLGPAGERYADPLFANGDGYFVFSRIGGTSGPGTVYVGSRFFPNDPFSPGVPFAQEALAPTGSHRKSMTGSSADVRTLFVWDEAVSKSVVVRLDARGAIESTTTLGSARDVQPTKDCRVFWFTSGSPSDVLRYAAP